MQKRTRWVVAFAVGATAAGAAIPAIGSLKQQWYVSQKEAYFAAAAEAIRNGADALPQPAFDMTELLESAAESGEPGGAGERDHARLRQLAMEAELGYRTPEFTRQLLQVAADERTKWLEGDMPVSPSGPGNRRWVNLGPQWARSQYNGTYYNAADSGRVNVTVAHPSPAQNGSVYVGTSGGGIWRTANIDSSEPAWTSLTESLGSLAIGGLDIANAAPYRIYAGLGDPFDQKAGVVTYSDDDGATWSAAIPLQAASHPAGGPAPIAQSVRQLKVDPSNANHVLVTTDVGLFQATDGVTFGLVDLPNATAFGPAQEATWSIVYLGTDGVNTHWAVSGLYACPNAAPPAPGSASATACGSRGGNFGDVWVSHDSGATWASSREAGGLPASWTAAASGDVGMFQLAGAAPGADPTQTVVYGIAASIGETSTLGIAKSLGGSTWTVTRSATAAPQAGLVNATTGPDCNTMNVGHGQSYYDLPIGVDPVNPNNLLVGGNLCGARSKDGGATWENVSHWLPSGGGAYTATKLGALPYVHADWHGITLATVAGRTLALVGSDGGLFTSRNLFDDIPGERVDWRFPDYGLTTHLVYAMGTGDPTMGNHHLLWAGLQDNGTRYRLVGDENFVFDTHLQVFDQVIGGDGIGGAVATDARGANAVYWASVQSSRRFCLPRQRDCQRPTRVENGVELSNWSATTSGDSEPFLMRFSALQDDRSSVVSASNNNVWRVNVSQQAIVTYARLTPSGIGAVAGATRGTRGAGATASPYIHLVDGVPARVYGVALTSGASMLIIDKAAVSGAAPPELVKPSTIVSVVDSGTTYTPLNTHMVVVPPDPALIGGTDVRRTWVVASTSPSLLPASVGRVFKTVDGGATWQPFHGNGTGADLPNTPIFAFRWDPSKAHTIWAGTELGVYRSEDDGQTWARYGMGMPMARVYDLAVSRNGSLVRAALFGRGLWEIHPNEDAALAAGTGDYDHDGVVDFFDVAALAARLGQTPSSSPAAYDNLFPGYDSSLDLAGSPATLEDADLTAQLARLGTGGQP